MCSVMSIPVAHTVLLSAVPLDWHRHRDVVAQQVKIGEPGAELPELAVCASARGKGGTPRFQSHQPPTADVGNASWG